MRKTSDLVETLGFEWAAENPQQENKTLTRIQGCQFAGYRCNVNLKLVWPNGVRTSTDMAANRLKQFVTPMRITERIRADLGRLARAFVLGVGILMAALMGMTRPALSAEPLPDMSPQQISPSAWFVQGVAGLGSSSNQNFISNAGFVVTQSSVVVFDALGSPAAAERLVGVIRSITALPISHVFVSHYHADHIYGLQVFKKLGAQIHAGGQAMRYVHSENAKLRLKASRETMAPWVNDETQLVAPDNLLQGPVAMTIGGTQFELRSVGPAHTPEDYALYLPHEQVLFSGDLVFRNRIPFVGDANSQRWVQALDDLLNLKIKVVVPGHGPASREPLKDMKMTQDYLRYLRETMGRASAAMEPFESAYANTDWSAFKHLPLFDAANRMNAYNTYLLMEHEATR